MEGPKQFLIDTDVLVDYLRGVKEARAFLLNLRNKGGLAISVINMIELYSGADMKDSEQRKIVERFLDEFEAVFLDRKLVFKAGKIRLNYNIPFADSIIAATALSLDCPLVSANAKHYSLIKGLDLIVPPYRKKGKN